MKIRVAVLGAGSWGTTFASLAAHNAETVVWSRDGDLADEINEHHRNGRYLPSFTLHPALAGVEFVVRDRRQCADVLVMGVPSHVFRSTLSAAQPFLRAWVPIVSLTKGSSSTPRCA